METSLGDAAGLVGQPAAAIIVFSGCAGDATKAMRIRVPWDV
jgi:hypothetical protein